MEKIETQELSYIASKMEGMLIDNAMIIREFRGCNGFKLHVPDTNLVLSLWPKDEVRT